MQQMQPMQQVPSNSTPPTPDGASVPPSYRVTQLIYLVFGVIEALIGIRVVLKLLAANPDAGFTSLIYNITEPFVALFQGVFPTTQSRGNVLELSSLLAIIVYALLAYVLVRLVQVLSRRQAPQ